MACSSLALVVVILEVRNIHNYSKVATLLILVTEGTCTLPGWVVGCIVGGVLFLLLLLFCFCYCCCVLGRRGRRLVRAASEADLVMF